MSDAASLIAPHQFEKTKRVTDGMDFAHLIGVNGRDWDRFDRVSFAAGDDEHFSFVIEPGARRQACLELAVDAACDNRTACPEFSARKSC